MVVAAKHALGPLFLTFFELPLSTCDKATTSPEHNFRAFKLSGWMITRFALRDSSPASDRETMNFGEDILLVTEPRLALMWPVGRVARSKLTELCRVDRIYYCVLASFKFYMQQQANTASGLNFGRRTCWTSITLTAFLSVLFASFLVDSSSRPLSNSRSNLSNGTHLFQRTVVLVSFDGFRCVPSSLTAWY